MSSWAFLSDDPKTIRKRPENDPKESIDRVRHIRSGSRPMQYDKCPPMAPIDRLDVGPEKAKTAGRESSLIPVSRPAFANQYLLLCQVSRDHNLAAFAACRHNLAIALQHHADNRGHGVAAEAGRDQAFLAECGIKVAIAGVARQTE